MGVCAFAGLVACGGPSGTSETDATTGDPPQTTGDPPVTTGGPDETTTGTAGETTDATTAEPTAGPGGPTTDDPTSTSTDGTTDADTTTGEPPAGVPFVYVSGYDPKIRVYRLDPATGALSEAVPPIEDGANPSFLAITPAREFLYAARESGSSVGAYAIDPATGGLNFLNEVDSEGQGPAHVATDATGAWVLVANYGGGTIAVIGTNPDGSLAAPTAVESHGDGSNPHQIVPDRDNTHLIVPNKGNDDIYVYPFEAATGALGEPTITELADGAGPRHVAVHPSGDWVYSGNELDNTISAFSYVNGALTEISVVSSLPDGADDSGTVAEIQLDPQGRYLYTSNRGHDSIAVHAVDPASGALTLVEHESTQGATPRGFHLDESGRHLIVANQNSGNVVGFAVDPDAGTLTPTGATVQAPSASFVGVIYLPGR